MSCSPTPSSKLLLLILCTTLACACSDGESGNNNDTSAIDTTDTAEDTTIIPDTILSTEGLVINELVAAGEQGQDDDWLELYNGTPNEIDLAGFSITDNESIPNRAVFPSAGWKIGAGAYLQITATTSAFPNFALGPDEELALFSPSGELIDLIDWMDGDAPNGTSYGRIPDGEGPFKMLLEFTPGTSNVDNSGGSICGDGLIEGDEECEDGNNFRGDACLGCTFELGWSCTTPGDINSCSEDCGDNLIVGHEQCDPPGDACDENCLLKTIPADIVINEVVSKNADILSSDWVEFYNVGAEVVNLSGWSFTDSKPLENRYLFPANTLLAPNAYLIVERDNSTDPNLSFGFNLSESDAVQLYNNQVTLVDVASWQEGEALAGSSFGRLPNGVGEFQTLTPTTKGEENQP